MVQVHLGPPYNYSEVAQLVEHPAVNRQVAGSSPAFGAIFTLGELSERPKEHDWKSCRRLKLSQGFKSLTLRQPSKWPVGQVVKTPPFHGGNTGSNPVRVILSMKLMLHAFFVFF